MTTKKLKLFVWENVLFDYTSGIMFALAYDVEEARKAIMASFDYESDTAKSDLFDEPEIVESVKGFHVWGGG